MSEIKVNSIKGVAASTAALTINNTDGTCTANITNNLSNRNMVINGASEISQRYGTTSTSISGTGVQFPVDRFIVQTNVGSGHSHQQVADAPTGFYYSQKVTCGTGGSATGSNFGRYRTTLEWQNVIPQSGFGTSGAKQLVLSFYVKSSLTGTFGFTIQSYANNRAITNTYTINSANTWERKTIVIAADTNSAWVATTAIHMELGWDLGEGADRGNDTLNTWGGGLSGYGYDSGTKFFTQSSATWQITGVQLEVNSSGVATDFEHRSFGEELKLCERYYQVIAKGNGKYFGGTACNYQSNQVFLPITFKTEMRVAPTLIFTEGSGYYQLYDSGNTSGINFNRPSSFEYKNTLGGSFYVGSTYISGVTAGNASLWYASNAASLLAFDSEL